MAACERLEVTGVVQGVGFRPFVHRLATELGLRGHVGNDSTKVFIEVAGLTASLEAFVDRLAKEAPPLADIEAISRTTIPGRGTDGDEFVIVDSALVPGARTLVPPDTAVCDDCRRELFDPSDRRCGHPFITCTNCGPRFTIIRSLPYDRPRTTMAGFDMCEACAAEYVDPADRRYHAQPIGCHDCGPRLTGVSIARAANRLAAGGIVAIKGLGGYHLACDATNDLAVETLRARKRRADKPFAVMVADLGQAEELAEITAGEAQLLTSPQAPIVLLESRPRSGLSTAVAPGNPLIGVMLAHTPLHLLLLADRPTPLVMTSANRHGEPLAYSNAGLAELPDLFDAVLDHDRPIHIPCDDSVVRMAGDRLLPIRRSRGYAPLSVRLHAADRVVLAVGGELKNTFCLAADGHAWVSQHLGDMENLRTIEALAMCVGQFSEMYEACPDVVAVDAHPGYRSSAWARSRFPDRLIEVQHHHGHVAAVMAEHELDPQEPILGFAFDGTGYGRDGTIWGGELLLADACEARRLAHLTPVPLPGGDAAARNPGRVALSYLAHAGVPWRVELAPVAATLPRDQKLLRQQLDRGFACIPSSSMGRLFDGVAALLGLRQTISYEAQAAIELESLATAWAPATADAARSYRFGLGADGAIDPSPVLIDIVDDITARSDPASIAWRFHDAVAEIVQRLASDHRGMVTSSAVALSGGVFQNALLNQLCVARLEEVGFTALTHSLVPPNDGGLALGQAFIAAHSQGI